ncbi:C-terminal processing peptidase, tail-specific protease [Arcticibacter svalbardensis MN12-7]|uniref:C-terminal processing peptidase, tail-specific protease n=1 Tax=Arcticibacter svalbardensis MN12-7 TaxID=1150600 RepID=R9GQT0_9SPHI|nr:S41 family peptidase [Arcticibacter svalbardensis]EOR94068.1 C-terminal processing peptidase, tail-specific protease [Arcticibacter svalbardensis MN12-7]
MLDFRKHAKKIILTACTGMVILLFAFSDDYFQASKNLEIFTSLYKEVNVNYVDEINTSEMIQTGIEAMLESMDPYTEFVPEADMEDYRMKYVSTQYGGIGTSVQLHDGKFLIAETFEGFPAQKSDLRAGDVITAINSLSLKGKSYESVSTMLKGPKGTALKITVDRPGLNTPLTVDVMRDEITQPNVSYSGLIADHVGYIKLDKFLENSGNEVSEALNTILKSKPSGLILDLRSNGGGILQEAVKIVNLFVAANTTVVTQKGKTKEKSYTYKTYNPPLAPNIPLVVLVNSRSASASEIVAGALQDLDRAVIIGQRSYGKGLVQQSFNLPYNSLIKITVAKYYTPSGRCIQSLDYTHRSAQGEVVKVADSLISEYHTKAGRLVYDGSGIFPDQFIAQQRYSPIAITLLSKFYIFDYATLYRSTHKQLTSAKDFRLTDIEYTDFVKYMSDKDYNYFTKTEKLVNELQEEAEKEKKLTEIRTEFDALKKKVYTSKQNDLNQFKDEIKLILENEIVSRYYFQKGRMEQAFNTDLEIKSAEAVLSDKAVLASILKGNGKYKSIGKPVLGFTANVPEQ